MVSYLIGKLKRRYKACLVSKDNRNLPSEKDERDDRHKRPDIKLRVGSKDIYMDIGFTDNA